MMTKFHNKARRLAAARATMRAIGLVLQHCERNSGSHLPLVASLIASNRDLEIVFTAKYSDLDILRISPEICHPTPGRTRGSSMLFVRGDSEVLQELIFQIRNSH